MIKYLIEKEFRQMLRDSFLPELIFIFPCMTMILMPWAANLEIKNINLNIVDNDHSVISRRPVDKIRASTYSHLAALPVTYDEALLGIEAGTADVILEIPYDFERDWISGKTSRLLVATNAVNGTKGGLRGFCLSSIISDYSHELMSEVSVRALTDKLLPRISVPTLNLYNPTLNYRLFMIPALMVMLLTLICAFLPTLNIVGEKEAGTIEQINVTPVNRFTFIAAKSMPYWLVDFVVLTICFILARLLYGILPAGHFLTIYVFALVFLPAASGFGLVISDHSAALQRAMFAVWLFMLVFILMSGLFTPTHSMPEWAQWITRVNPLRYFAEAMYAIYLCGGGLAELLPQLGVLLIFAIVANIWAVRSYRKNS